MSSNLSQIDFSPKGYLIRYPLLVDACVKRFIDDFQDDFKAQKNGVFKLRKLPSKKQLKQLLETYLDETINSILSKAFNKTRPSMADWIIVSDSGSLRRACFKMLENDVDISLNKFETIFNDLFDERMSLSFSSPHPIIYCKHKLLLADDWGEKICKAKIFGKEHFFTLDKKQKPLCVIEALNENDALPTMSKKENALIINECIDWLRSFLQMH